MCARKLLQELSPTPYNWKNGLNSEDRGIYTDPPIRYSDMAQVLPSLVTWNSRFWDYQEQTSATSKQPPNEYIGKSSTQRKTRAPISNKESTTTTGARCLQFWGAVSTGSVAFPPVDVPFLPFCSFSYRGENLGHSDLEDFK